MMGTPFTSIGKAEKNEARAAMAMGLSGYLAGKARGGYYVQALEEAFASTFHVMHAIACNSATSGLMAAAAAIGLWPGDKFICPAMTMSATAAAPMFAGATPEFMDVSEDDFSIDMLTPVANRPRAIVATSLFGHPAKLRHLRQTAELCNAYLIEDNSQSPFAMEGLKLAGTVGHIGVFSFNVHKPLQCGEGGMIVTDSHTLADRMRGFINHGEVDGGPIGFNLRMPEVSAAIALTQLRSASEIIGERIEQAEDILDAIGDDIPGLRLPETREGCSHIYYTIPFVVAGERRDFCKVLKSEGVPIVEGYVPPLYRLPAFAKYAKNCPVAEALHDHRLFYIENCRYSFTAEEIAKIGVAFKRAAEKL